MIFFRAFKKSCPYPLINNSYCLFWVDPCDRAVYKSRPAGTRLLGSRVWIPLRVWMFVSYVLFCVVSVVTPSTSWSLVHRNPIVCVCVCGGGVLGTSRLRRPRPLLGYNTTEERRVSFFNKRRLYHTGFCEHVRYFIFHKMLVISCLYHLVKLLQLYVYGYSECVTRS
jgi:hypothetical protein